MSFQRTGRWWLISWLIALGVVATLVDFGSPLMAMAHRQTHAKPLGARQQPYRTRRFDRPGLHHVDFMAVGTVINLTPKTAARAARPLPGLTGADALDDELAAAPPNSTIHLSSGRYPKLFDVSARRGWLTISGAGDRTRPIIEGAGLFGARKLRLADLRIDAAVQIAGNNEDGVVTSTQKVQILDSDISCGSRTSSPATTGVSIRDASSDITIAGDWIHNCTTLVGSVPTDPISSNIIIEHSLLADAPGWGIVLGALHHVTVEHDLIEDINDPTGETHDDAIAFWGNTQGVSITNDVLANSRAQIIMIQPAYAGRTTHTAANANILIQGNLIYGAGAVAVQDQSGVDVRILQNTFWDNHLGSVWLTRAPFPGIEKTPYTVLEDNIIEGYELYELAPSMDAHNLIVEPAGRYAYGPDDVVDRAPDFFDSERGDFELKPDSPARHAAATGLRATTDLYGLSLPRDASIGALQPTDPQVSWQPPIFENGSP